MICGLCVFLIEIVFSLPFFGGIVFSAKKMALIKSFQTLGITGFPVYSIGEVPKIEGVSLIEVIVNFTPTTFLLHSTFLGIINIWNFGINIKKASHIKGLSFFVFGTNLAFDLYLFSQTLDMNGFMAFKCLALVFGTDK